MRVWRLVRPEFAPDIEGRGARLVGGRWNSPGNAVVYVSDSLALAALEVLVNLLPQQRRGGSIPHLVAISLELPDDLVTGLSDFAALPPDPGLSDTRDVGDRWLTGATGLALRVPSRVIPPETNLLINPLHPDMARVRIAASEELRFDDRLAV